MKVYAGKYFPMAHYSDMILPVRLWSSYVILATTKLDDTNANFGLFFYVVSFPRAFVNSVIAGKLAELYFRQ